MFDTSIIIVIAMTFLLAGAVKGVIGMGLPTVSLAVLTVAIDLPHAMALLLVPSLLTNLWQGLVGGNLRIIFRRLWLFLLMATITVWLGAKALRTVDANWLSALLGGLLVLYAIIGLAGIKFSITARHQRWLAPVLGVVNGILTGMTGSMVVPGVMYLQAIGLSRDELIQAMGILFSVSTLALALALQTNHFLSVELALASALALVPALIGMLLGQRIRKGLSEVSFRRFFFVSLFVLGAYICLEALL